MRKLLLNDKQILLSLVAQLEDFDSRYYEKDYAEREDLRSVRNAMIVLIRDWFATPDEWKKSGIKEDLWS